MNAADDQQTSYEQKNAVEPDGHAAQQPGRIRQEPGKGLRIGTVGVKQTYGFAQHGSQHHGGKKRIQRRRRTKTHDEAAGKNHAKKTYREKAGRNDPQAEPDGLYVWIYGLKPDVRSQTGKGTDHDRIAMRKNNDVQYTEKQGKADSHQSVHHAEHESVHDELREQNAIHNNHILSMKHCIGPTRSIRRRAGPENYRLSFFKARSPEQYLLSSQKTHCPS